MIIYVKNNQINLLETFGTIMGVIPGVWKLQKVKNPKIPGFFKNTPPKTPHFGVLEKTDPTMGVFDVFWTQCEILGYFWQKNRKTTFIGGILPE